MSPSRPMATLLVSTTCIAPAACRGARQELPHGLADDAPYVPVRALAIETRRAVREGRFQDADSTLRAVEERYERGEARDMEVGVYFSMFKTGDPKLGPRHVGNGAHGG